MMKFRIASLAVAVTAMFLLSCSRDKADVVPGTEGVSTVMMMTLDRERANTTRAHYGNLNATAEESTIGNVTVYIFNSAGILEDEVVFDANTDTKLAVVTTGQKTFLAAANITALPSIVKGTTTLTSIKNAVKDIANIDVAATDDKFWMTSTGDNTKVTLVEMNDPADVPGTVNDVTIPVGRAVAKVGVFFDPDAAVQPADGRLENANYKVHNNPNRMKLFTSNDNSGYRITPYYDVVYNADNYFNNPTYLNTNLVAGKHEFPSYMTENSNLNPRKGVSTFVMIRGEYTPDEVLDRNTGQEDPSWQPGDDFWRIADVDGNNKIKGYEDGFYSANPSSLIPAGQEYDGVSNKAGLTVRQYINSQAYYGLWLYDSGQVNNVTRFTVKRNQYWSLEITAVNGCGDGNEDDVIVDPEEPIGADTNIRATISVEAWEDVEQPGVI